MGSVIRIQEQSVQNDVFHAVVSFDYGPQYPITVRDPFDQKQEAEVEWYFEQHLEFPFTQKIRARNAATSISTYGEVLFKHVFQDNEDVYAEFKALLKVGLEQVQIEVTGSPKFHALHWEALKDPKLSKPLALQAMMVRRNLKPPPFEVNVQPGPTINLLIVTARPYGMKDVSYRTISRPLVEALRQTDLRVNIDMLRPGTYKTLENHLRETTSKHGAGYYHVIHFDLHGALLSYSQWQSLLAQKTEQEEQGHSHTYHKYYALTDIPLYTGEKAFLFFEGEQDDSVTPVEASALANMLRDHHIPVAILNACQSGKQIGDTETSLGSSLMQAGVQLVLAMGYSITVSGAVLLMTTLYQHLFASDSLSLAIRHARNELANQKKRRAYYAQWIDLEDWLLPVVYQNRPVQLTLRDLTLAENKAYYEHKSELERIAPPEPTYGFIGRDLDILQIEKRLLTKRNILLVRGMGGAGKTTLLRHLSAWWCTTGLIERVFYFGYDERAWNRQQIMVEIAQQLLDPVAYVRDFQPLSLDAQQSKLASTLRAHRYLLILDNLESITGTNLAILHTLDKTEQEALRRLLAALVGGKTLVLLGSRGGEDWLAKGTFGDNVYDLPGLDPEAASTLADLILEHHDATKYRQEEDLRHLLNLLDGFPLALEVVLPNLAHQTPKEVLDALQAGDVDLDTGNPEDKTKSILRCIDYSHSNLSPEAQQLLLCLAPFTSVIDQGMLENYTAQLKQQPALASLPFERWSEVLQEAANWGLLSPDPDIPRFLRLQPIFPYFLRNRLDTAELSPMRASVETAFRLHYDQLGDALYDLLKSKEPQKRQVGQVLTSLEYTNLSTALDLALAAQVSILNLYRTLSTYLDSTQEQGRGLELGESVLKRLETYPSEKLTGMLGAEFVFVIDDIAKRQLLLKDYAEAGALYSKALAIWLENKSYEADEIKKRSASIYHQLGIVAQEQRQWKQAEAYYQQALQIKIEYQDRYAQASTYHQLGMVAQEQRQWEQAEDYYLHALETYVAFKDNYSRNIVVNSLARLWLASGDPDLPSAIGKILGVTPVEVETILRQLAGNDVEGQG